MDVTFNNFKDVLPEILKDIDTCDFIAIDGEFTGLRNGHDVTAYDIPSVYYNKLRDGSLDFLLIQVGLCTFKFDRVKNKYVYKAYNFYVYPRPLGRNSDTNFLCQSSCIAFLCNSGFDFNKLFKEGIPYLNIADEEILREELTAKYGNLNQSESSFSKIPIPEELTSTVENVCSRIEKFLSPENEEKEITFDRFNGFLRKLIFQTVYERFSSKNFSLSTKWVDHNAVLVAQKGKSKAEQEKMNYDRDRNELSEAVGFSKVIKHISNSKKLIVGHNMLLDICHIVNRFCWPLPENYWEFKEMVHHLFPKIIDTKYICSAYPFRDLIPSSIMDHMVKRLHEAPFEFPEAEPEIPEFGYSTDISKAHEAGFDAYITGLSFLSLTSYLGKKSKNILLPPDKNVELLKPYENKLFIMKIVDYSYVNLKGNEPKPNRNHVFHITFPKEWKTNNITQLFSPYGDVHISYCNQITAWVTLLKQDKVSDVITNLIESNYKEVPGLRKPYILYTWSQYLEEHGPLNSCKNSSLVRNRKLVNNLTLTPNVSQLSAVGQSSGDAEIIETESESLSKDSTTSNKQSRKRKKSQISSTKLFNSLKSCDVLDEVMNVRNIFKQPKQTISEVDHISSNTNLLLEQVKGIEDSIQRTFEEPPW